MRDSKKKFAAELKTFFRSTASIVFSKCDASMICVSKGKRYIETDIDVGAATITHDKNGLVMRIPYECISGISIKELYRYGNYLSR